MIMRSMNINWDAGSTNFWLVDEVDFSHGFSDDFISRVIQETYVDDLSVVQKKRFQSVRCVKDENVDE